eukprot:CAMPEP_0174238484 /NCGR_PEP_ID=MMETSP0417-20130205/11373_1 /TAXON_ID=242541 /ORGANISM="Mayorella sp, Strain BSH-02190019" /LENGTH=889 /DNA_ID=CAMNT_0015317325 /DNA_START=161 /DNA_END=2826 /DNA_ORIENTATION=+
MAAEGELRLSLNLDQIQLRLDECDCLDDDDDEGARTPHCDMVSSEREARDSSHPFDSTPEGADLAVQSLLSPSSSSSPSSPSPSASTSSASSMTLELPTTSSRGRNGAVNSHTLLLSAHELKEVPLRLVELCSLVKLDLSRNSISTLPSNFGDLASLRWLNLSNNQIEELPDSLCEIEELTWLYLMNNELTCLPAEFEHLSMLEELFLAHNNFEEFPESLGWLPELDLLDLSYNRLTELPEEACELSSFLQLEDLNLSNNELEALPEDLANLRNLVRLDVSHNKLRELPSTLSKMIQVRELDLSHNQLTSVPLQLAGLSQLSVLHIVEGNELDALPPEGTFLTEPDQLCNLNFAKLGAWLKARSAGRSSRSNLALLMKSPSRAAGTEGGSGGARQMSIMRTKSGRSVPHLGNIKWQKFQYNDISNILLSPLPEHQQQRSMENVLRVSLPAGLHQIMKPEKADRFKRVKGLVSPRKKGSPRAATTSRSHLTSSASSDSPLSHSAGLSPRALRFGVFCDAQPLFDVPEQLDPEIGTFSPKAVFVLDNPVAHRANFKLHISSVIHCNFVGQTQAGPTVLSITKDAKAGQFKFLLQTAVGPSLQRFGKEALGGGSKITKMGRAVGDSVKRRSSCPSSKDLLRAVCKYTDHAIEPSQLQCVNDPGLSAGILQLEDRMQVTGYKFGLVYVADGQTKEEDFLSNAHESADPRYRAFLEIAGDLVNLKGYKGYAGGLDTLNGTTGEQSVVSTFDDLEVMFHVCTLLPYDDVQEQQISRKRHIGNDIVVLVFKLGEQPFDPRSIKSEFIHVYVVVTPTEQDDGTTGYTVETCSRPGVSKFSPPLPSSAFVSPKQLHDFLMCKLINAERAAYAAPAFAPKLQRTRATLLDDLIGKFVRR